MNKGLEAVIIYNQANKPVEFAACEIKKALVGTGYIACTEDLKSLCQVTARNHIILATRGTVEANLLLERSGIALLPASEPEGYSIRKKEHENHKEWYIIGFDDNGTMIGGLDFGQSAAINGLDAVSECDKRPYIKKRGIKYNIPLDARTPSYSDSGDSAQANLANTWDMGFWHEFLDEMARNHFNVLSLWSLHPFPSLVKVPEYPDAALQDVMKTATPLAAELEGRGMSTEESLANLQTIKLMTIEEKIGFWRQVMQYAKDHGIDIYIFIWNIFIYGTEGSGYGFTTSITDASTCDYFRKSVKALINTYPLLKGISVTAGENMSRDVDADEGWLYSTYGEGINDALALDEDRTFSLIHRIQYTSIRKALRHFSGLNPRCSIYTSFKYSQAHMYSSVKPDYIHANGDIYLRDIGDRKTWLTVRDDDYYMFRGGCDPEFARDYIRNMPNEKLQGFYMGPDGYIWGREFISKDPESSRQLVMKKRWYSFMLWGMLSYDPDIPDEFFIKVLGSRYAGADAQKLFDAWSYASQIIPMVNRFHNSDSQLDFQWYPEACAGRYGLHDINQFINTKPQSGEGIVSIPDYAEAVLNHLTADGETPPEIAGSLWELAEKSLALAGDIQTADSKDLRQTIEDITAMSLLGKYYSRKILGATNKCLADQSSDMEEKARYKNAAIECLKEASVHWRAYAAKVSSLYIPQALTRLIPEGNYEESLRKTDITRLQADVDNDINLVG